MISDGHLSLSALHERSTGLCGAASALGLGVQLRADNTRHMASVLTSFGYHETTQHYSKDFLLICITNVVSNTVGKAVLNSVCNKSVADNRSATTNTGQCKI